MGVTRQTAILLFVIPMMCFGTVQVRDLLTFEGVSGTVEEAPLSPLLHKRGIQFVSTSSANYAGYVASWQIRDGTLFLSGFTGWIQVDPSSRGRVREVGLNWLFSEARGDVPADWYSGPLHLSLGKTRATAKDGHIFVTDVMIVFAVENGRIARTTRYEYPKNVALVNERMSKIFGTFDIVTWQAEWGGECDCEGLECQGGDQGDIVWFRELLSSVVPGAVELGSFRPSVVEPAEARLLTAIEVKELVGALQSASSPSLEGSAFVGVKTMWLDMEFGGENRQFRRIRWNNEDVIRFLRVYPDSHTSSFILFRCPGFSLLVDRLRDAAESVEPLGGH